MIETLPAQPHDPGLAARAILAGLVTHRYAGFDPYDGMASARVPAALAAWSLGQRMVTQAVKRCPWPLQPLLGVRATVDSYTLGHVLLAAARFAVSVPAGERDPLVDGLAADALSRLRCAAVTGEEQTAWGYHFPVSTRFAHYAAGTPNVIVTAFVVKGLVAAERAGLVDCRDEISGAAQFVLRGLKREVTAEGQRFGYLPDYCGPIHNANSLAALILAEAGMLLDEAPLLDEALAAARDVVAHQRPDGSWPYADEPKGDWVDGFHTGFVLDGLWAVWRACRDDDVLAAIVRGGDFYWRSLFGAGGQPYYTPQRHYPHDALSAAQGIETLTWYSALDPEAGPVLHRLVDWTLAHMVKPDGRVAYQVWPFFTDWRQFPRWSLAPMCSALAGLSGDSLMRDRAHA